MNLIKAGTIRRVVALALLAATWGVVAAQDIPAAGPNAISSYEKSNRPDLLEKIRQHGEVGVIVGLSVPSPTVDTARQQSRAQRELDIANEQDSFVSRMATFSPRHIKKLKAHPFVAMRVDEAALAHLLADQNVVTVEDDILLHPQLTQTPTILHATEAWDLGFTGANQVVAILDSGVDGTHPFLSGKVVAEACFSSPGTSGAGLCPNGQTSQIGPGAGAPCAMDGLDCWHGTSVAGVAAGKRGILGTNAGGMAPDAGIISVQVFHEDCSQTPCVMLASLSDMESALDYVYTLRSTYNIAAVNISAGSETLSTPCDAFSPSMAAVISTLKAANIATVASSGNDSSVTGIHFPSCISSAVSVGATTKSNTVASFSNSVAGLSLLATGKSVYSSLPGGTYGDGSGTSFSAPHVAGAWAVLKSARPALSVDEVLSALQTTGLPIRDPRNGLVVPVIQISEALASFSAPAVALTAPMNDAVYAAPASVSLAAAAADSNGTITKVEFYQGAKLLGTATAEPYSYTWSNAPAGSYVLTAKAYDNYGARIASIPVNVSVKDVTAPALTVPVDMIVAPNISTGAVVVYPSATALDDTDPKPRIKYSKRSGRSFPFGTTTVAVTATDKSGNTSTASFNVTVQGADPASVPCNGHIPTIVGSDGPDLIKGTPGPDVIAGLGGNDRIFGFGGDDIICGGDGNDKILGGDGNDQLFGEGGDDMIAGNAGDDTLNGGTGNDSLSGGVGDDKLDGGDGTDTCNGGLGTDTAVTCETVKGIP